MHRKTFSNSKQIGTLEFKVLTIIKNQLVVNGIKTNKCEERVSRTFCTQSSYMAKLAYGSSRTD